MPRERISNSVGSDIHGGPETYLRVGWLRDAGHVQIGSIADDGVVLEPTPEGNGFFLTLDRARINHLIRTLRKARDQAYGADA